MSILVEFETQHDHDAQVAEVIKFVKAGGFSKALKNRGPLEPESCMTNEEFKSIFEEYEIYQTFR